MPDTEHLEFGLGQLKNCPIVPYTNAKESGLSFEGFAFFMPGRLALLGHVCDCGR